MGYRYINASTVFVKLLSLQVKKKIALYDTNSKPDSKTCFVRHFYCSPNDIDTN